MFNQNTQVGFGVMQMTSPDENIPHEIQRFFTDEQPWGTDRNLHQIYVQNFPRIRDSKTLNRRSRIYLRYLNHSNSPLIESIAHAIEDIFYRQTNAFKMNLSFSFLLQHRETGEFHYHYASNNNQILNSPCLIRNQQDLENLLDHLAAKDFPSHLKDQCPNTKWVIERIVSLRIHLVMTTYPLGNPPNSPTISRIIDLSLVWKKTNIMHTATRIISVSSVVWPLENLKKPAITVIKKLNNFLINIVSIFKSILKILKGLN